MTTAVINKIYQKAFPVSSSSYKLLPFRFIELDQQKICLVNDIGEYYFVSKPDLFKLVQHKLEINSQLYLNLRSKHFLVDDKTQSLLDVYTVKYRTKKSFTDGLTQLHMIVPTLRCNHSCHYCQVSRVSEDRIKYDMSIETAKKIADLLLQFPAQALTIEFQGGEPLLNFPLIQFLTERLVENNKSHGKSLDFVVTTNLSQIKDEMMVFFKKHDFSISTSLDGPECVHNHNRPNEKKDSYQIFKQNLVKTREALGIQKVSALMTTTRFSLKYVKEIIDEYVSLNFKSIFLRPLNPYGFAAKLKASGTYSIEEFLDFYYQAFEYILKLNKKGIDLTESFARIILTKILTPFPTRYVDLETPTGAGFGALLYNYDGSIYPADEARMLAEVGDYTFRIGNIKEINSIKDIFASDVMKEIYEASCAEALPACSDCAFLNYCGADPINNYTTQGNIFGQRPTSDRCKKQMGITKYLFSKIDSEDKDIMKIFMAWITQRSVREFAIGEQP